MTMAGISLTLNYGPDDPRRAPYQRYVQAVQAFEATKASYLRKGLDPKSGPEWRAVVQAQQGYVQAQSTYQQNVDAGRTPTTDGVGGYVPEPVSGEPTPEEQALLDPQGWAASIGADVGTGSSTAADDGIDEDAAALLERMFAQYGISGLGPVIRQWLQQGYSADTIALLIRDTPQYKERFPAMEALAQRGMALTESQYIDLERQYRGVMVSYGLPQGFYDRPDDFAGFIINDVSPRELDQRVFTAQQFLNSSNPEYLNALQEYYGISRGAALAYVLDPEKAQDVLRREMRAAEIGAAGSTYGFDLSLSEAAGYAQNPMVEQDAFNADTLRGDLQLFQQARRLATLDSRLARIDQETYRDIFAVDTLLGDENKRMASQRRGQREAARFSGSSAVSGSSLSARRAQG